MREKSHLPTLHELSVLSRTISKVTVGTAERMDFSYGSAFGMATADAYNRLLLDFMLGDQTLFTRADEVEEAWRAITPALAAIVIFVWFNSI